MRAWLSHVVPSTARGVLGAAVATLALAGAAPAAHAAPVTAIGGGCDVRNDGTVTCEDEPRGTGVADASLPSTLYEQRTFVHQLSDATRVDGDDATRCALRAGGVVSCWGAAYASPLRFTGPGEVVTPVQVPNIAGATDLAVSQHACVITAGGELRCWGADDDGQASGQVPSGGLTVPSRTVLEPTTVAGVPAATDVAVASGLTCIVTADRTVWCWGLNTFEGRLGLGPATGSDDRGAPAPVPGLTSVAEIDANGSKICARRTNGDVWCWGRFSWRAPDLTWTEQQERAFSSPAKVAGLSGAVELAVGRSAACARTTDGHVRCWGDNSLGQLGALARRSAAALEVRGLSDATALTNRDERPCALRASGEVSCWGAAASATAKDPAARLTTTQVAAPARGITTAVDLGVAANHWCALLAGGEVRCAGVDMTGPREERLGVDGLGAEAATSPELGTVSQQITGATYSCFLTGGAARCLGLQNVLADPVQTWNTGGEGALSGIVELAGGNDHACALTDAGRVWCWGSNADGQVGAGPPGSGPLDAAALRPTTQVTDLIATGSRSCALRDTGTVVCWGKAAGPSGGDSVDENVVALGQPATGLEVVDGRTCATFAALPRSCFGPATPAFTQSATCALQTGQVWCTGDGISGMLGTGSEQFTRSRSVPVVQTLDAITVPIPVPEVPRVPDVPVVPQTPNLPLAPFAPQPPAERPLDTAKPRPHTLRSATAKRKGTTVSFKLVLERGSTACTGTVRTRLKVGRRSVTKRASLRAASGERCAASVRLKLPRKARGKATLRWSAAGLAATVRVRG